MLKLESKNKNASLLQTDGQNLDLDRAVGTTRCGFRTYPLISIIITNQNEILTTRHWEITHSAEPV